MLIPSIDLMGGKIVQLIPSEKKTLAFDDFDTWVERLLPYSMTQLIDLDAALGHGNNRKLVEYFAERLPCQVGGGIRNVEAVHQVLRSGAKKVIIGSGLFKEGNLDLGMAKAMAYTAAAARLIFAIDSRGGRVAINGWKQITSMTPEQMMLETQDYCGAFLYTHIDNEGTMSGISIDTIEELKQCTHRKLIAVGGIRSMNEVKILDSMGVDAVVGLALYNGTLEEPRPIHY